MTCRVEPGKSLPVFPEGLVGSIEFVNVEEEAIDLESFKIAVTLKRPWWKIFGRREIVMYERKV